MLKVRPVIAENPWLKNDKKRLTHRYFTEKINPFTLHVHLDILYLKHLSGRGNKSGERINAKMPDHVSTSSSRKVLSTFVMLWKHVFIPSSFPSPPPLRSDCQHNRHRHGYHLDFSICHKENMASWRSA